MSSIEHELKLILNSTTIKLISERKLAPTNFHKKYHNTKTIKVFLASLNFGDNIEIPVFSVPIDYEKLRHRVYYCEVAVGKSLFVGRKYATMFQPPDDYDSFMVENDEGEKSLRQSHLDTNKQSKYIEEKKDDKRGGYGSNEKRGSIGTNEKGGSYNDAKYNDSKYNDSKYSDAKYNDSKHSDAKYNDSKHSDAKYSDTKYSDKSDRKYSDAGDRKYSDAGDRNSSYKSDKKTYASTQTHTSASELINDLSVSDKSFSPYTNASTINKRESPRPSVSKPFEDLANNMSPNLENMFYIIKDQSKINPLYEVEFDYDKMLDEREKYLCEMCQQNPSIMFCLAERASFCKFCDRGIHDNEFTQRHKRYYYDHKKDSTVAMCSIHFEEKLEYYCRTCNNSFCKDCNRNGPCGNEEKHDIVDFSRGCDLIKHELDAMKQELVKVNETVIENITMYQSDLKEFNVDVSRARQLIEMDYQNALNMLNNIVRQKYQIYNALYIEKVVVKERMTRMVDLVENSETVEMVKEYNNFKENKNKIDVRPERIKREKIIVKGELKVFSGDEKIKDEIYVDSSYRKNRY